MFSIICLVGTVRPLRSPKERGREDHPQFGSRTRQRETLNVDGFIVHKVKLPSPESILVGRKPRLCLVVPPRAPSIPFRFTDEMLDLLVPLSESIVLVTGEVDAVEPREGVEIERVSARFPSAAEIQGSAAGNARMALQVAKFEAGAARKLIALRHQIDLVIFYMAWPYYLLPAVAGRIVNVPTLEIVTRSTPASDRLLDRIYQLEDHLLTALVSYLVPESEGVVPHLPVDQENAKILQAGPRYVDTDRFRVKVPYDERPQRIGYVGRLAEEKGVRELLSAFKIVAEHEPDLEFLIGGTGPLLDELREEADESPGLDISIPGWIPDEDLPDVLNSLRFLVMPSKHSEGLPTILLESFACATPVIATPQGAITDLVNSGETGFILRGTDPESMADRIQEALQTQDLDRMSSACHARASKYSYSASRDRWERILESAG